MLLSIARNSYLHTLSTDFLYPEIAHSREIITRSSELELRYLYTDTVAQKAFVYFTSKVQLLNAINDPSGFDIPTESLQSNGLRILLRLRDEYHAPHVSESILFHIIRSFFRCKCPRTASNYDDHTVTNPIYLLRIGTPPTSQPQDYFTLTGIICIRLLPSINNLYTIPIKSFDAPLSLSPSEYRFPEHYGYFVYGNHLDSHFFNESITCSTDKLSASQQFIDHFVKTPWQESKEIGGLLHCKHGHGPDTPEAIPRRTKTIKFNVPEIRSTSADPIPGYTQPGAEHSSSSAPELTIPHDLIPQDDSEW
jgi:hypothetical protein